MDVYVGTAQESVVLRTVQTGFASYFKLHGFSEASNVGLCAAIYVVEYSVLSLFHNIYSLQNQELQRAKCAKTGIDSCSYAGKVAVKHTRVIGELSNKVMPIMGRGHNHVILVAYKGHLYRLG